jgi:hypothetical protein
MEKDAANFPMTVTWIRVQGKVTPWRSAQLARSWQLRNLEWTVIQALRSNAKEKDHTNVSRNSSS